MSIDTKLTSISIVPIKTSDDLIALASFIYDDIFYCSSVSIYKALHGNYRIKFPGDYHPIKETFEHIEYHLTHYYRNEILIPRLDIFKKEVELSLESDFSLLLHFPSVSFEVYSEDKSSYFSIKHKTDPEASDCEISPEHLIVNVSKYVKRALHFQEIIKMRMQSSLPKQIVPTEITFKDPGNEPSIDMVGDKTDEKYMYEIKRKKDVQDAIKLAILKSLKDMSNETPH